MMELSLNMAKGACKIIKETKPDQMLENVGVIPEELNRVVQDVPWSRENVVSVTRTLDSLVFATLDHLALPRFEVPAEYLAGIIAMFVHPVNYMAASNWMQGNINSRTMDLAKGEASGEKPTSAQLFALVCALCNDGTCQEMGAHWNFKVNKNLKNKNLQIEKGK